MTDVVNSKSVLKIQSASLRNFKSYLPIMDPLNAAVAVQLIADLEAAEGAARQPGKRFSDGNGKDPFVDLSEMLFIQYFRVTKDLARHIIDIVTPFIPVAGEGSRLTVTNKVLAALRFFATGSYQGLTGSDSYVYMSQSSVSISIRQVASALNRPEIFDHWVHFPNNLNELRERKNRFFDKFGFPGIVGCIDCTHVAIIAPGGHDQLYPEHIYVNRKPFHSINVQLACDENLKIFNVNARYPGSAHDARIWRQSELSQVMENIYRHDPNDMFFLLGDSGYPLRPWLQTPLRNPQPGAEEQFNNLLTSIRSLIERCNGVLKNRFRCLLKHRVLHYSPTIASEIINACVVLHNMCIEHNVDVVDVPMIPNELDVFPNDVHIEHQRIVNPDLEAGRALQRHLINTLF